MGKILMITKTLESTRSELTTIRTTLVEKSKEYVRVTKTIREKCKTQVSNCQHQLVRYKPAPRPLENAGKNCWWKCDKKSGPCNWCGGGKCCRKMWGGDGCSIVDN